MAVTVPMADGAKVIYIPQLWLAEMVPTQEGPYRAKLPLFVPVIVVLVTVTAVVLVLLKKTGTGWVGKFKGTVPNSIGLGKQQRERWPVRRFQFERGKWRRQRHATSDSWF
jgi:hypothetical protein